MNEFIPKFITNDVILTFGGKNDQLWGLVKPKNFKNFVPHSTEKLNIILQFAFETTYTVKLIGLQKLQNP